MVHEAKQDVVVGDGTISCTKILKFFEGVIRGTTQRIIFIDTPGLDDTEGKKVDEQNVKNLFKQLGQVLNIKKTILMIRKESVVTNTEVSLINSYRQFLNTCGRANEASLIRIYLSFCDITDKAVLANGQADPDGDTLTKIVK